MTAQDAIRGPADFFQHLEQRGMLSAESRQRAAQAHLSTGHPPDLVLTELGLLGENDLTTELRTFLGVSEAADNLEKIDVQLLKAAPFAFFEQNCVLPIAHREDAIVLAVANPFDRPAIDAIAFHFDRHPDVRIHPRTEIARALKQLAASAGPAIEKHDADADFLSVDDVDRLRDIAGEAPVVRFVAQLVTGAVDLGATDIHLEPLEDHVRIRLRCDGMLRATETVSRPMYSGIVSRIKILSRLNIAERRLPQDGRMRMAHRGQNVDFRVAITPSIHGESIVLRILDRSAVDLRLSSLGFGDAGSAEIMRLSYAPNGIVLVTGPTGSGKTTTLYAILNALNRPDVKIFTVEDPVEYRLAGVTQFQVDMAIDLDFARALRSVLRQDPDVILVGEIRDRETAEIAIRAALTGHLVFSTLHTNSAAGALTRLRDMGIDSYLLGATIRGIIGQRLLRRRCRECGDERARTSNASAQFCATCSDSGYVGRTVAYEVLPVSASIAARLAEGVREDELSRLAASQGMVAMEQQARRMVAEGITTEIELRRVVQLGEG